MARLSLGLRYNWGMAIPGARVGLKLTSRVPGLVRCDRWPALHSLSGSIWSKRLASLRPVADALEELMQDLIAGQR
jgi:hypothetical protein